MAESDWGKTSRFHLYDVEEEIFNQINSYLFSTIRLVIICDQYQTFNNELRLLVYRHGISLVIYL